MTTTDFARMQAAKLTGPLWAAIREAGGIQAATSGHRHFPRAYDPIWTATLPLPINNHRQPGQRVALLDEGEEFERFTDARALGRAYADRPRTRVYEDIGRYAESAWYSLLAYHLGRLTGSELQVIGTIFQSRCGDESLEAHRDTWYAAIVQMRGRKVWRIGEGLLRESDLPIQEVTTNAGDILLIPKGLPHMVHTPEEPGYSVHLSLAIDRDPRPLDEIATDPQVSTAGTTTLTR